MAIIYQIYNDINNKVYIGETIRSIKDRWNQHLLKAQDKNIKGHLQQAIRKYGAEHFFIRVIEECKDEIRFEREKYWIKYYDSYYNGYNSNLGGNEGFSYDYDLIKQLWQQGKTVDEISKIVNCSKGTVQNALKELNIPFVEHINRTFADRVIQYTLNGQYVATYESLNEAGRAMGKINGANISKCCQGKIKTSYGYIWVYERDKDKIKDIALSKKKKTTGRAVLQYDLNGNFIKEYESCEIAGKILGKAGTGISRCARGERQTAYGYKWKYKN